MRCRTLLPSARSGVRWHETLIKLAIGLNVSLGLLYIGFWLMLFAQGWMVASDFTAFYTGWTIALSGDGAHLYDLAYQGDIQEQLLAGRRFEAGVNPFNNPPHLVLPFLPFAWLPLDVGYLIWTGLQLILLIYVVRWFVLYLGRKWSRSERLLLLSALIAFPPLFVTTALGTFSLLVLLCMTQLYQALSQGRERPAALWWVLGTLKPQLMVAPFLMLLGARRWGVLIPAAALALGLGIVPMLLFGPAIWLDYTRMLQHYTTTFDLYSVTPSLMWNVRGTLTLLLGRDQAPLINSLSYLALAAAGSLVIWLWRGDWKPGTDGFDLRFALTLVLGMLTSPHLNQQDGLLLALPAALGYRALRGGVWGRPYGYFVAACPALILFGDRLGTGSTDGLLVRVPVLTMIVLACWLALALRRVAPLPAAARVPAG